MAYRGGDEHSSLWTALIYLFISLMPWLGIDLVLSAFEKYKNMDHVNGHDAIRIVPIAQPLTSGVFRFCLISLTPALVFFVYVACRDQISDHLTWAGPNAAHALGLKHTCHITWPLYMLEETGLLPLNSLARWVGVRVRNLLSSRFSPMCMKPAGPPRAMLERVRQNCLGSGERNLGGGLLLVTSSFGIESPRPLPPFVRVIGRGHRLETVDALAEHEELKVCFRLYGEGVR